MHEDLRRIEEKLDRLVRQGEHHHEMLHGLREGVVWIIEELAFDIDNMTQADVDAVNKRLVTIRDHLKAIAQPAGVPPAA